MMQSLYLTRRCFLRSAVAVVGLSMVLASLVRAGDLPPTPGNALGPYYRAGAPFRNQLFDDDEPGIPLLVTGQVLAPSGEPLAGALLDVWQANADGDYDNDSPEFRGRGRLYTDDDGSYWFYTIWPGHYENPPGSGRFRPAHIHVRVSQSGYRLLTTQLYFKDDPYNPSDPGYRPELELDPQKSDGVYYADFTFVLARE